MQKKEAAAEAAASLRLKALELQPRTNLNLPRGETEVARICRCNSAKLRHQRIRRRGIEGQRIPRHRRDRSRSQSVAERIYPGHILMIDQIEALTKQFKLRPFGNSKPLGDAQIENIGFRLRKGVASDS